MTKTDVDNKHTTGADAMAGLPAGLLGPVSYAREGQWGGFGPIAVTDCICLSLVLNGRATSGIVIALAIRLAAVATDRLRPRNLRDRPSKGVFRFAVFMWLAALAVILVANLFEPQIQWLQKFPSSRDLFQSVSAQIDQSIRFLTTNFGQMFDHIRDLLNLLIVNMELILGLLPWPVYFMFLGLLAWSRGGASALAVIWLCLGYIGLFGYWDKAIVTSALVLTSLAVCMVIGIPLGIVMAKSKVMSAALKPVLDFMQTLPSFVYLLPAVAFFSIGKPPALIATVIFAMPPLIRLTALGITQVPDYVREALYAHGATPMQCLLKAELPLALPSIRTGLNQCIMMSLAMVVIAALIGGGGLGYDVLFALQNVQHGQGLLAGIGIVACAIIFDRLLGRHKAEDEA